MTENLRDVTAEELKDILTEHSKFLSNSSHDQGKRADLRDTNLRDAELDGANLSEADLFGADLSGNALFGVNLSNANMCLVNLNEAEVQADMSNAILVWAKLKGCTLQLLT